MKPAQTEEEGESDFKNDRDQHGQHDRVVSPTRSMRFLAEERGTPTAPRRTRVRAVKFYSFTYPHRLMEAPLFDD